jgi:hypothetical protein
MRVLLVAIPPVRGNVRLLRTQPINHIHADG